MVDIATRVWNHKWKIDPIVRSLIDTDFYKLLMCQSVFRNKPDTQVTFSLINRSKHIRLAELIDEGELREQLDHIRTISLSRGESTWLRGNTFYGKRQMFRPDFMEWFENLRLPPYHLDRGEFSAIDCQQRARFGGFTRLKLREHFIVLHHSLNHYLDSTTRGLMGKKPRGNHARVVKDQQVFLGHKRQQIGGIRHLGHCLGRNKTGDFNPSQARCNQQANQRQLIAS